MRRNISVIQDANGNNIVMIHDIRFKGKRSIKWKDVKKYLTDFIGKHSTITESGDMVFIGKDLPDEFTGSKYTFSLKGALAKAKANAAQGLPEMIEIASNKRFSENHESRHAHDARQGWYRFDSRFGLPIYDSNGNLMRYNIYHTTLIVRHSADGKMYLYDILSIKKETSNPLG